MIYDINLMGYDKFTFFWNGPFSQWHGMVRKDTPQINLHGMNFNTAEKYMMWRKATLFKDQESVEKILASGSPSDIKAMGKKVKNFDVDLWNAHAKDFVFMGNVAKFSQNKDLADALLATEGTLLVEASPYDKIWGIGLAESHPGIGDPLEWQGSNWLGEVLTMVREALFSRAVWSLR